MKLPKPYDMRYNVIGYVYRIMEHFNIQNVLTYNQKQYCQIITLHVQNGNQSRKTSLNHTEAEKDQNFMVKVTIT